MTLPGPVQAGIEAALHAKVVSSITVEGGCISETARAELVDGRSIFIKHQPPLSAASDIFIAEANGLRAIAETRTVRVPQVLHAAQDFIALEWLEPHGATAARWRELGAALARLHRQQGTWYGWPTDNLIGSLPQSNQQQQSWAEFWWQQRLQPQLELACTAHRFTAREASALRRLGELAEKILNGAEADGASLLHGDLWSGNVHMMADSAALIDPSVYYGHREVDIAMTRLFGGFSSEFYRGYETEWPLLDGAAERLPFYQLYYVLVHVNLFGGSYAAQALALAHALSD